MFFKQCTCFLLNCVFILLFFSFNCLGFETPSELPDPELTTDEKNAIDNIDKLPKEIASVKKTDLATIFNEADLIEYFKEVGDKNFSFFIKSIGDKKAVERYIRLFKDKNEFKKFVADHNGFKDFVLLSKTPRFNEKFQIFAKKTFDQALKDNPILVS